MADVFLILPFLIVFVVIILYEIQKYDILKDPLRRGFCCKTVVYYSGSERTCSSFIKFFSRIGSGHWVERIFNGEEKKYMLPPIYLDFQNSSDDEDVIKSISNSDASGSVSESQEENSRKEISTIQEIELQMVQIGRQNFRTQLTIIINVVFQTR